VRDWVRISLKNGFRRLKNPSMHILNLFWVWWWWYNNLRDSDPLWYSLMRDQVEINFRNRFHSTKKPSFNIFYAFDHGIIIMHIFDSFGPVCAPVILSNVEVEVSLSNILRIHWDTGSRYNIIFFLAQSWFLLSQPWFFQFLGHIKYLT